MSPWASIGSAVVAGAAGLCCLYVVAVLASGALLGERGDTAARADTILVLGGDGPARAEKAIDLWRQGLARHAIVAGDGDCLYIRDAMVAGGVPDDRIAVDCLSRNTWENAENAAVLLESSGTRSAILVTSWFHTGRALRVLRLTCPGIRWTSVPTEPPPSFLDLALGPYGPAIVKEYAKAAGYRLREQFSSPPATPPSGHVCNPAAGQAQRGGST